MEQDPLKGVCGIQPLYSLLARKVAIIKCQKYQNEHQWMLPSLIQIIKQVWKYYAIILEDLQVTLTCTLMDGYGYIM